MNITKDENEDFVTYTGKDNREREKFKLNELSPDRFKCIIFVKTLT